MLEKGVIREAIHYKDQFVSHLFLASRKDGGQRPVINLKDFNTCIHTLQTFQDGKASSIKENFGTRPLSMQVGPQRRLLLCFIEETVEEICTFQMGGFPVRIPLYVFWTWPSSKVVYKINKSASLHPLQIVYKNNNIPRRSSNTRENFGGKNHKQGYCGLPVTESRICYKLKEISCSPNTENKILQDDNRLSGDGSITTSRKGRVDF